MNLCLILISFRIILLDVQTVFMIIFHQRFIVGNTSTKAHKYLVPGWESAAHLKLFDYFHTRARIKGCQWSTGRPRHNDLV